MPAMFEERVIGGLAILADVSARLRLVEQLRERVIAKLEEIRVLCEQQGKLGEAILNENVEKLGTYVQQLNDSRAQLEQT
jgi:hypothetical protein